MPRPKRSKFTLIVGAIFIAFAVLGALPLVLRSGDGQLVQPNCTTPAVATGPAKITPGTNFAWQAAGPQQGPYVLALDPDVVSTACPYCMVMLSDAVTAKKQSGEAREDVEVLDVAQILRRSLAVPDPVAD